MAGRAYLIFMSNLIILLAACAASAASYTARFEIRADSGAQPIAPAIYGANQQLTGTENWGALRQGGNRLTGYNWENNASTAGTDWNNSSDNYLTWTMGLPSDPAGIVLSAFLDSARAHNRSPLITLPMAGYVARDKDGEVYAGQTAPSSRWCAVKNAKPSAFSLSPDLTDSLVYVDECLNFIINHDGAASPSNLRAYALDNEPALWPSTHPRIHPAAAGCAELVNRSADLAGTIRRMDPGAAIFGPVLYGFNAYISLQDAPDWNAVKSGYGWFIDYYLDRMKRASDSAGTRLLDVLDVHWYSEAMGNGERIVQASDPADSANAQARLQAPRSLWDSSYTENSWIGQWFSPVALIPHLKASVDRYFPGTGIAITEFNYGGENHVSGGIAMADVLGIFGRYGLSFASYWQMEDNTDYTSAAYRLYRNFDGSGGAFGGFELPVSGGDRASNSLYAAAQDSGGGDLHLIILNKAFHDTLKTTVRTNGKTYSGGSSWLFDGSGAALRQGPSLLGLPGDSMVLVQPPLSALHAVLSPVSSIARPHRTPASGVPLLFAPFMGDPGRAGFSLPAGASGSLAVFDVRGRMVASFKDLSGNGSVAWRRGRAGNASMVYLVTLACGGLTAVKPVAWMK